MNEFEIIEQYFSRFTVHDSVLVAPGDDCAVLELASDQQLIVTTDTLVEGVHFPKASPPEKLAYRSCATALSDIAAMGGHARWASLALTLPSVNPIWLDEFSHGVGNALALDETSLIGGDLTQGPLSITWHITGTVATGQAILRSGAEIDDDIWVSGTLGGAAQALNFLATEKSNHPSLDRYWQPIPRLRLARTIRPYASSCIDISDGFLGDLRHILKASGVSAIIELIALPIDPALDALTDDQQMQYALCGGDDYELCFTAKPAHAAELIRLANNTGTMLSRVGKISSCETQQQARIYTTAGEELDTGGYLHFR